MSMDKQLTDLSPSAYAPYRDPREYITSWTDRIWIKRGLGQIHDHYAPGVKVHTCYGETYDLKNVIGNSIQRMVAFPNRGGRFRRSSRTASFARHRVCRSSAWTRYG